ncbi:MAG: hypothetical protein U0744_09605 [Gemmataceae bacterium]
MALSLVHQQRDLAQDLRGRVVDWRTVTELDECLFDLLVLLKARVEAVDPLHKRARKHLDDILGSRHLSRDARDQAEILNQAFAKYLDQWRAIPPRKHARHDVALAETIAFL